MPPTHGTPDVTTDNATVLWPHYRQFISSNTSYEDDSHTESQAEHASNKLQMFADSGAGTNLKVGWGTAPERKWGGGTDPA